MSEDRSPTEVDPACESENTHPDFPASPLTSGPSSEGRDSSSSVQVAVRVRPLLALENGSDNCVEVFRSTSKGPSDTIRIGGSSGPRFTFDQVFDTQALQADLYGQRVAPLVASCLEGFNATVLAYGQTGSGKTFSMMGPNTSFAVQEDDLAGVIPRAIQALFDELQNDENSASEYQVRVQFLELYGEEIRDLLSTNNPATNKCTIRDLGADEPEVVGATQRQVDSAEEALRHLTHGMLRRVTGSTAMNNSSSRSHAILSVLVEQSIVLDAGPVNSPTSGDCPEAQQRHVQVKRSKFNFVDLAGSERQKRTQAEGKRLREGIDINKGLLVLGNVISALGDPKKRGNFVPYRDSKLTRLLKGSLGGNHKTLMIACVSPSSNNMEESLNCIRYANRAKNIQNNAVVNLDANSRLVAELRGQISSLASDLLRAWDGQSIAGSGTFSREALQTMALGSSPTGGTPMSTPQSRTTSGVTGLVRIPASQLADNRLGALEIELSRTKEELRQAQGYHDAAEEQLYVAKAEKELYQLQLSVLSTDGGNSATADKKDQAFLEKAQEYEREIGALRKSLKIAEENSHRYAWNGTINDEEEKMSWQQAKKELEEDRERLAALKSFLSSAHEVATEPLCMDLEPSSNPTSCMEDTQEKTDQAEIDALTSKYLAQAGHDSDGDEEQEETGETLQNQTDCLQVSPDRRQKHLHADLVELSRSISAKEDLIDQLKLSQEKYADMRSFYEDRLRQMEATLQERESEREQLVQELEKAKAGSHSSKDLEHRLKEKEAHIANLKKRQRELRNLTTVSSRNDAEINRLQSDVKNMKHKKVELQKQLGEEKKNHMNEVKRLKKTAMQMDRELNKWKKVSHKREMEAQRANQVAKARLDELGNLRTKYKDAEKRLRMASVKRGVMKKAGLDSVIVGRRNARGETLNAHVRSQHSPVDTDSLRDYFDQKVAVVVRKEALVDKLAREWEEHFELTSKKEELTGTEDEGNEDIQSLDWQIQFKEEQIRQLAQRLGKHEPQKSAGAASCPTEDSFIFDKEFKNLCDISSADSSKTAAARVLFGMVVRERRRVAALARTASSLDEKVLAAEKAAEMSEVALRSYMDEQRHEIASLSQSQQEHILSLMEMVKEDSSSEANADGVATTPDRLSDPKLLVLANERISVLERQLLELKSDANAASSYREQLEELKSSLFARSQECTDLEEELFEIRSTLREVRRLLSRQTSKRPTEDGHILEIVSKALHPNNTPVSAKLRKRVSRASPGRLNDKSASPRLPPSCRKHSDVTQASDSTEDFVEPEWAADIMADLALIAEGKVPPSLQGNSEIIEGEAQPEKTSVFDRLTDPVNFTGTQKQAILAEGKVPASPGGNSTGEPHSEKASVFERLNDPDNFTGVQKHILEHKIHFSPERPISCGLESHPEKASANGHGVDHNKSTVTQSTPAAEGKATAEASSVSEKDCHFEKTSVFDRLNNPENFTGTQKQVQTRTKRGSERRHKSNSPSPSRGQEERRAMSQKIASQLDKIVVPGVEQPNVHHDNETPTAGVSHARTSSGDSNNKKRHKSVFERLLSPSQFTGTQKDRLKKHKNHDKKKSRPRKEQGNKDVDHLLDDLLDDARQGEGPCESQVDKREPGRRMLADYTQKNVFERLQRTTTQAFAVKHNGAIVPEFSPSQTYSVSGRQDSPEENSRPLSAVEMHAAHCNSNYTSQNVFKRLQKTTTEAYAKKTHKSKQEEKVES